MKKHIAVFLVLASQAFAQTKFADGPASPPLVYASLPSAASSTGKEFRVTDCLTAACSAGGGSIQAKLFSNGTSWQLVANNGSGGGTIPSTTQLLKGDGAGNAAATNLTGDVTTSGAQATTLVTVNSNVGACGDATHVCQVTVNAKGLTTAASAVAITAAGTVTVVGAGSLTSTALVTGGGSQTVQTPAATATMDSSGNIATPGVVRTGGATDGCATVPSTTAGCSGYAQGVAPVGLMTTGIQEYAPTSVTSYDRQKPGTVGSSGVVKVSVSGTKATESFGPADLTTDVTNTLSASHGGTGITSLGTGVATALGANVSGAGAICLASGSACAGGSAPFTDFQPPTSAITMSAGSPTDIYAIVAPALASGKCYATSFAVELSSGPTEISIYVDATLVWDGILSLTGTNELINLLYCNGPGTQTTQYGFLTAPYFYGAPSTVNPYMSRTSGATTPAFTLAANLDWSSGHTIHITGQGSGTVTGLGEHTVTQ